MGGKVSADMLRARALIEKGATAYRAAKTVGLTTGAITRSQWYCDRVIEAHGSPMDRAQRLVTQEGYTASAAARECGISPSSISRAPWYRKYSADLIQKLGARQK